MNELSNTYNQNSQEPKVLVIDRCNPTIAPPSKFVVLMHNDDFTPMDFVIDILIKHFGHNADVATQIMMNIHNKGNGIAGVFSKDIAETKAFIAMEEARIKEYPFLLTVEKE
jgi:ATP-dependent Clp protease adaptor protein ClpS